MRILIIGGTGLISTAITRQLLERGTDEIVHYNRGRHAAPEITTITGDRTDHATFEQQMRGAGHFDAVIDMVGFTPADADSAIRAFGGGKSGHYVFCSTVDVYDKPYHSLPVREDHPLKGTNDYGRNKAEMERRFFAAHDRGDLNVTTIRPGHTYNDNGTLIHAFGGGTYYLHRLRENKPIIVHGDGSSIWTLAHADDVARAFVGALGNSLAFGKAYNATGEELLTWNMLYRATARTMGWYEPRLVHVPTDLLTKLTPTKSASIADNFQFDNIMDNSRAKEDLGYRYTITFKEAVQRIVFAWDTQHKTSDDDDPSFAWYDALLTAWERHGDAMASELRQQFPGGI